MSQLTITLDDDLLAAAQAFAQHKGKQLDALVAEWLQATVQPAVVPAPLPLSPIVRELYGCAKLPDDYDYRKAMEEALLEKYGI